MYRLMFYYALLNIHCSKRDIPIFATGMAQILIIASESKAKHPVDHYGQESYCMFIDIHRDSRLVR